MIPAERQRRLAGRIPGATVHEAECGHAGCVMQSERFVPVFLEAARVTSARMRDTRARGARPGPISQPAGSSESMR